MIKRNQVNHEHGYRASITHPISLLYIHTRAEFNVPGVSVLGSPKLNSLLITLRAALCGFDD